MKQIIIIFILIVLTGLSLDSVVKDVSAKSALVMIMCRPDLVVIDVSDSYEEGSIPDARKYRVNDGTLYKVLPMLDKSKKYLIYGDDEESSRMAAKILVDNGFGIVYRLRGEIRAWIDSGFRLAKH